MYIGDKTLKVRIFYIILVIFLFSCKTTEDISNITEDNTTSTDLEDKTITVEPEFTQEQLDNMWVDNYLSEMTLEEKVGQIFIFHIHGYTELNRDLETFLNTYTPGGIILFADNIVSDSQVLELNRGMMDISSTPLFVAVDEEGGIVSRLGRNKSVSVTHLPPALTVGSKNNSTLAYNSGKVLARELKALGFNTDFAPVADVNTNPQNPVIGNRTYSHDPHIVADMIEQFLIAFDEESMIGAIKHFPGHGDTSMDTHNGTVVSPHSRERLDQVEFIPFIRGIENSVDMIMSAHITMPGISSVPLPATLNKEIITGILRNELGYDGIIITDALEMGAIGHNFSAEEASVLAFKAGIDILLMPSNQKEAYNAVLTAVNSGDISLVRLENSVRRILKLKKTRGLFDNSIENLSIKETISSIEHQNLIDSITGK